MKCEIKQAHCLLKSSANCPDGILASKLPRRGRHKLCGIKVSDASAKPSRTSPTPWIVRGGARDYTSNNRLVLPHCFENATVEVD